MPELLRLRADHAAAVLAFETANRAYFATSISDRGDAFFEEFTERFAELVAEQEAGERACYVLEADDGSVVARFNLLFVADGVAEVGYRMAQHAAGQGLATATLRDLCRVAATRHGVRTLRAATASGNPASQRVLRKAGFVEVGEADPEDIGGKAGVWYELDLAPAPS